MKQSQLAYRLRCARRRYYQATRSAQRCRKQWQLARNMMFFNALHTGQEPDDHHPSVVRVESSRVALMAALEHQYSCHLQLILLQLEMEVGRFTKKGYRLIMGWPKDATIVSEHDAPS